MKILHVVGARPNFPKVAPLMAAMKAAGDVFQQVLVHTGQHYDASMSQIFFEDLHLPEPDEHLNVGSGSHAWQTAQVMTSFEPVLLKHQPDWVFVVGDVNSTLACALVSVKLGIPAAHVEAGLRSWDRSMPEEINRILTDQIADLLFTPSEDGDANLLREGIPAEKDSPGGQYHDRQPGAHAAQSPPARHSPVHGSAARQVCAGYPAPAVQRGPARDSPAGINRPGRDCA